MTSRDRELLNRWATDGDARAFDTLVSGYSGLVYSACRRISGNASDAEDATQECFLQLVHKTPQIRTSLGAWLHTVATRQAINGVRRESRLKGREREYSKLKHLSVEANWDDVQDFIDEALEALPDDLREPVVGSFLERKSHEVIAEEIGVDRSTVTRRIDKGIEKVRGYLKEKGVIVSSASLGTLLSANAVEAVPAGLTASLGKIAIAGESLAATEVFVKGGLLGGMSVSKGLIGLASLIVLLAGFWLVTVERTPEESTLEVALVAPVMPEPEVEIVEEPVVVEQVFLEVAEPVEDAVASVEVEVEEVVELAPMEELEEEPEPEPESEKKIEPITVSGRVYNESSGLGLGGIGIQIYEGWGSQDRVLVDPRGGTATSSFAEVAADWWSEVLVREMNTESDGRFSFEGVEAGRYRVVTGKLDEYTDAKSNGKFVRIEIGEDTVDPMMVDISLTPGGTMTGVVRLGKDLLRNTELDFMVFSAGVTIDIPGVRTDSMGRYRIDGLETFTGSLVPRRKQDNGEMQHALAVAAEVLPNEETEVNIDFISGTSSIEGRVFYENTDTPIQSRIWVYFGWMVNGEYLEEIVKTRSDATGYYIAEGLPAGNAEMHIFPSGIGGGIERIETIHLGDREQVLKDIVITSVSIIAEVTNVPVGSRELFIIAHPGEVDVKIDNLANFTKMRDTMVGLSQNRPDNSGAHLATLKGLKPGRYTITASAWPVMYSLGTVQAYGYEKLFEDIRTVSTFVTIEDTDKEVEVELELPAR